MKEILSEDENVKLLWTGGWDSTFQLLRLLIIHRRSVTPFYLTNANRRSADMEILTMKLIRDRLLKEYPYTRELLQPTQYFLVKDISPDSEITEAYQSLRKEKFMGIQYEFLPRFCKEKGITDIQLCIHHDDKAHFVIEQIVSESNRGFQTVFHIDQKFKDMNEYVLFQYFSFPIFNLSKLQMSELADEQGWKKIMGMTWFCHNPTKNMQPCGICNPCLYTIEEGLGWRIPMKSRIISFFYREIIWPLRSLAKTVISKIGLLK